MATEKQLSFLGDLLVKREVPDGLRSAIDQFLAVGMTAEQASALIAKALEAPFAGGKPAAERVTEPGEYRMDDGRVAVVKRNRAGTNLYAGIKGESGYEKGLIYRLNPADRIVTAVEQAFTQMMGDPVAEIERLQQQIAALKSQSVEA